MPTHSNLRMLLGDGAERQLRVVPSGPLTIRSASHSTLMITRVRLILRNLSYFRGVNLALVAGMIVATAVLTGAMMVGDSVRDSLASLARQRLGKIDDAIISRRFFDQALAARLAADPQVAGRFELSPAIVLQGGASNENETVRAGGVQVLAAGGDWAPVERGRCILNVPTSDALGIRSARQVVLLSLPSKPDEPREAALSRRSREDTLAAMRANVAEIHQPSDMLSLFNPQGGQRVPQNVWVNLADLQEQIDLRGRVNLLLAHDKTEGESPAGAELLTQRLKAVVRLEDYGLSFGQAGRDGPFALTSRTIYLDPPLVQTAEKVAAESHLPLTKVTVNLINSVSVENGKTLHYAVAAGLSRLPAGELAVRTPPPPVRRGRAGEGATSGENPGTSAELADDEIVLNQWTADQLGAKVGDRIRLKFYRRNTTGDLMEVSSDAIGFAQGFRVARILPMSGIGADPSLTPSYKGLTDADTIADWNPPEGVEINKKLVTKADEDYWHQYRAAPKLFLSFAAAQKLWGEALGSVTSIRVPAQSAKEFERKLNEQLDPASMGLAFQPIKAQQLAASSGSTDFAQLFIAFSFFLIVAAVLLVAMLFRLNVEQRARQIGLMSAVGFKPWGVRRLALGEGMTLAVIGAVLGIPAAIGYTWLMIYGLRTWWRGAVGTTALHLSVTGQTLAYGLVGTLIVAFFAILWAVWHVGRTNPATLLAGGWGTGISTRRTGRWARVCGIALVVLALLIFAWSAFDRGSMEESFMSGGALLLFGVLVWLGGVLRPGLRRSDDAVGVATVRRLGVRNASRHTARSVLAVGLIAFAAFTLITVASMKQGEPTNTGDAASGAGGYRLIVSTGMPLLGDMNTELGRRVLGVTRPADPIWSGIHFVNMRRWAGQDVSCLNLTQPTAPAILSVPPELAAAPDAQHDHRFTFAQSPKGVKNPWTLLDQPQDGGAVPVIADDSTATYILHLKLGDTISITDASGTKRPLKLVATLANSIFQSELLMGDANFRSLFPTQDGFGVVLVDCPAHQQTPLRQALNTELGEYAANAEPTSARLAQYLTVQNTYLSTFQALGALGLMLGTIGLAVVLVRTVIERRAELALLASLGFNRSSRTKLVLSENVFLLVLGLLVGAGCAIVGIIPALRGGAHPINYGALAATLLAVLLIGVACSSLAVLASGAHVTPADLRRE